jgi:hypothetical protein
MRLPQWPEANSLRGTGREYGKPRREFFVDGSVDEQLTVGACEGIAFMGKTSVGADQLPTLVRQGSVGGGCCLAGFQDLLPDGRKPIELEDGFTRRPLPVENADRHQPTVRQRLQELQRVALETGCVAIPSRNPRRLDRGLLVDPVGDPNLVVGRCLPTAGGTDRKLNPP